MGKKIVRCLEAFDLQKHHDPRVRGIEIVGEELPVPGNIYVVEQDGYWDTKEHPNVKTYLLQGFDFSAYGIVLYFNQSHFEIIEGDGFEDIMFNGEIVKGMQITYVMKVNFKI